MIDYVFFHEKPFQLFMEFLFTRKIELNSTVSDDSYEISIDEDLAEELLDEVEEKYEELFALNQQLMEESMANASAGVVVNLADGTTSYADIPGEILSRIMSVITPGEMGDVVNAIVDAIEKPDSRTLCQRVQEQE